PPSAGRRQAVRPLRPAAAAAPAAGPTGRGRRGANRASSGSLHNMSALAQKAQPNQPARRSVRAKLRGPTVALDPDLSLASWRDADHLFHVIRAALVPIDQALVLVSQTQRSGGTLLNTLFDGHPQLHVH